MPETKQISATIDLKLANEIDSLAVLEDRSFSQMVEILLKKALLPKKKKGDESWKNKYIK